MAQTGNCKVVQKQKRTTLSEKLDVADSSESDIILKQEK
jgi:hypothetical protein